MNFKSALTMAFIAALMTMGTLKAEEPKVMSPHSQREMKSGHTVEDHHMNAGHLHDAPARGQALSGKAHMNVNNLTQFVMNVTDLAKVEINAENTDNSLPLRRIVQVCDDYCKQSNDPGKCGMIDGIRNCDGLFIPGDRAEFLACFSQGVENETSTYGIYRNICKSACKGFGKNSCTGENMRTSCKMICCSRHPEMIQNCLSVNGDTCAGYR